MAGAVCLFTHAAIISGQRWQATGAIPSVAILLTRRTTGLMRSDIYAGQNVMSNGFAPSAIAGDTLQDPSYGGVPLQFVFPYALSGPTYTDLPAWWSPARDWVLSTTVDKEAMWGAAVSRTATKFAAHGYVVKDANDSQRKISASQELLKRANGGEGWVPFALKVAQDLLTTDNGVFVRVRRAGEKIEKVRAKAADDKDFTEVVTSSPGAKITDLYHLDSMACVRTGNLAYPVRYRSL